MSDHLTPTLNHSELTEEHYDPVAGKLGMWLFLVTEIILFGILFLTYAVYLSRYKPMFTEASKELDIVMGAANTIILLTSSLLMVLSIAALQRNRKTLCLLLMSLTLACALIFLVVKGFEWRAKFSHGIYPNSPDMADMPYGQVVFFGLYFMMTGIHALHVIAGMVTIMIAMIFVQKDKVTAQRINFLDNTGLYWHLVDVIWIYLFPLFYLIG